MNAALAEHEVVVAEVKAVSVLHAVDVLATLVVIVFLTDTVRQAKCM